MKRKLFTGGIAVMLCLAMSGNAQQKATSYTEKENMAVKTRLNFNNRADFEDAHRGLLRHWKTKPLKMKMEVFPIL